MGCLFCDIISGKTPSTKVYENDRVFAFEDINPSAPVHTLIIHKNHTKNLDELTEANSGMMSEIFLAVREVARIQGVDKDGYRVIINNGPAAGQVIWHLHVHVLGGLKNMGPMLSKK
jgi:histidine triad (HIT) family protein